MNVLGISFGRKMSNCEIMVKAALKECEKQGHEIHFIEADTLNIKPCTWAVPPVSSGCRRDGERAAATSRTIFM